MPSHELNSAAWLDELEANTGEEQPAYGCRSPLSPKAAWPATDPTEARVLAERLGADNAERLHELRLQGVRQQLIKLFNLNEVSWEEKQDALAYLAEHEHDLPRLTRWEKNVRRELEGRRERESKRKMGLRGVLKPACAACGSSPGYNAESCSACYAATQSQAA